MPDFCPSNDWCKGACNYCDNVSLVTGMQKRTRSTALYDHDEQPKRPCNAFCYYLQAQKKTISGFGPVCYMRSQISAGLYLNTELDTAARRFSVAAPRLWNSLSLNCRTVPSVNTFELRLKTFSLFRHNDTVARASVLWRDINWLIDWLIDWVTYHYRYSLSYVIFRTVSPTDI